MENSACKTCKLSFVFVHRNSVSFEALKPSPFYLIMKKLFAFLERQSVNKNDIFGQN